MLNFQSDSILQTTENQEKIWTIPELLETCNPLPGEPLAERTAALQKAAEMASKTSDELSENVRLRLDFWKNFQPQKLAWHAVIFKTTVDEKFDWELKVNELGIFYRDVSGQYGTYNNGVSEQLFSDFWFFGPRRPMPDFGFREKIIGILKNGFANPDCAAANHKHEPLPARPRTFLAHPVRRRRLARQSQPTAIEGDGRFYRIPLVLDSGGVGTRFRALMAAIGGKRLAAAARLGSRFGGRAFCD